MHDLETFLMTVISDQRNPAEIRQIATDQLTNWQNGFVPSIKKIREIRDRLEDEGVCARLLESGLCPWLRKNAKLLGLRVAAPGQSYACSRTVTGVAGARFDECPGFKRKPRK